jgi:hypothetical protein
VFADSTVGTAQAIASIATRLVPPSQRLVKRAASIPCRIAGMSLFGTMPRFSNEPAGRPFSTSQRAVSSPVSGPISGGRVTSPPWAMVALTPR